MDFGQDRGLARLALLLCMSLRVSSFTRVWPETWKRTMEILGNFPKWGVLRFFLLTNELQSGSKKEMRITLCNSVHGSKELSIYLSSLVFGLRSPPPSSFSGGRQAKHKFSRGKNAWTKSFKGVFSN